MGIKTQFLFMISDTNSGDDRVLSELEKSVDGDNVAFIYNTSPAPPPTCNVSFVVWNRYIDLARLEKRDETSHDELSQEGLLCTAEEMTRGYIDIIGKASN